MAAIHKRYKADGLYAFKRGYFAAEAAGGSVTKAPDHRFQRLKSQPGWTVFVLGDDLFFLGEHIANRQLGTVQQIDAEGNLHVRLDSGQHVKFNIREHPHVDYGYAVTSHSSQGATADRVLVHVDTEQAHDQLVNSRMAYVSVSRGRYDAQIYTDDAQKLGEELSRDVSKQSAMETGHEMGGRDQGHAIETAEHHSASESHDQDGQGYSIGH